MGVVILVIGIMAIGIMGIGIMGIVIMVIVIMGIVNVVIAIMGCGAFMECLWCVYCMKRGIRIGVPAFIHSSTTTTTMAVEVWRRLIFQKKKLRRALRARRGFLFS